MFKILKVRKGSAKDRVKPVQDHALHNTWTTKQKQLHGNESFKEYQLNFNWISSCKVSCSQGTKLLREVCSCKMNFVFHTAAACILPSDFCCFVFQLFCLPKFQKSAADKCCKKVRGSAAGNHGFLLSTSLCGFSLAFNTDDCVEYANKIRKFRSCSLEKFWPLKMFLGFEIFCFSIPKEAVTDPPPLLDASKAQVVILPRNSRRQRRSSRQKPSQWTSRAGWTGKKTWRSRLKLPGSKEFFSCDWELPAVGAFRTRTAKPAQGLWVDKMQMGK